MDVFETGIESLVAHAQCCLSYLAHSPTRHQQAHSVVTSVRGTVECEQYEMKEIKRKQRLGGGEWWEVKTRDKRRDDKAYIIGDLVVTFVPLGTRVAFQSNETPTWCNTVQVLFLQCQSTCFGRKRPSSGIFKTIQRPLVHVLSLQVSHHISLLGPLMQLCRNKTCTVLHQVGVSFDLYYDARKGPNKEMWWLTCNDNTCTSGRCTSFKLLMMGACARNM